VNVGSINSFLPFPTSGPYSIAKYGVEALSETLKAELSGSNVSVTCVYPGGVRTNISRSSRHTTGEDVAVFERAALTTPGRAARLIIRGIRRDKKRILVGPDARLLATARRLFPAGTLRLMTWMAQRMQRTSRTRPT